MSTAAGLPVFDGLEQSREPEPAGELAGTGLAPVPGTAPGAPVPTAPPGTTGAGAGAGPLVPHTGAGAGAGLVPVLAAPEQRIALPKRLLRSASTRAAAAWASQKTHRTFWHLVAVFLTRPPESFQGQQAHLDSRKWLQPWMTGAVRTFCEKENLAWGWAAIRIRMVLRVCEQNTEKIFFERQWGFWAAFAVIVTAVLLLR